MALQPDQLMSRSKKLVAVCIGLFFLLGLVLIAQGFIDTKNYRAQIGQTIKEKTGQDINIKGKVTVSLLPIPTLYVPGFELHSEDVNSTVPSLTADMVYIRVPVLSLFSDHLEISKITFDKPSLELQRAGDGVMQWGWFNKDIFALLKGQSSAAVEIIDGKLLYRNNVNDSGFTITGINASGRGGARPNFNGSFVTDERRISFDINTEGDAAGTQMPLNIRLFATDESYIDLKGIADLAGENFTYDATLDASLTDILFWVKPVKAEESPKTPTPKTPLKLTGKWKQSGWKTDIADAQLTGMQSTGAGGIALDWTDVPSADFKLHFSELAYEAWQALGYAVMDRKKSMTPQKLYKDDSEPDSTILPKTLKLGLDMNADKLTFGEQVWKNAKITAVMQDAAITVNQFAIELPGDATLTLFGIISEGGAKNLRFEGSMETQGKSLRDVLTIIDPSAVELPDTGFGDFYARSNIFVSPEQVRLSEADVKINELLLSGGMVAYFDSKPRVEADVRLKDINFDYFRDVWRAKQSESKAKEFFLKLDRSVNFSWLRKLKTGIDFKVTVDQFTFLDRKGDRAAFRLYAKDGEFGIYNASFAYPDDTIEANFTLNVNDETPFINLIFNTSQELNTAYFDSSDVKKDVVLVPQADVSMEDVTAAIPQPAPAKPAQTVEDLPVAEALSKPPAPKKDRWSTELLDMSWMEGINGSFDITAGRLVHDDYTFNRVKVKATLENKVITFQSLSFLYWQGRCDVKGSLYGGRVPGMSVGFTIYNADLHDILKSVVGRESITGKVGISGTIQTSGVNMLSWLSQADSKLTLAGRGVNVENFNIQGVVDTVGVSRTTADVVNNVNRVIQNGSSVFNVDGYVNIKNGIVKTPGIALRTGNIVGNLTGEVRLVSWVLDLSTLYQFPSLPSDTVPTMVVKLTGSIDDPALQTDTDSLEAYVSKRIIGR